MVAVPSVVHGTVGKPLSARDRYDRLRTCLQRARQRLPAARVDITCCSTPSARHQGHIGGSTRDGYKGILTSRAALSRTDALLDELKHCRAQAVSGCPGSRSAALLCLLPLPNSCTAFTARPLQDEQTRGVPLPVREVVFDSEVLVCKSKSCKSKAVDRASG